MPQRSANEFADSCARTAISLLASLPQRRRQSGRPELGGDTELAKLVGNQAFPQVRLTCPLSSPVAGNSRFARQEGRYFFEQAVELLSYEPITFAGLLLQSRLIEYLYASAAVGN